MNSARQRPAVFLDRDGTLMEDVEYCGDPAKVHVFAGAPAALARLQHRGFALIMATNQSGLGRGYFSEDDFRRVQAECLRQLAPATLEACYHCPEAPDGASERRKPGPGMLLEAAHDHGFDLRQSYMVGDTMVDMECGRRAGVAAAVLVLTGKDKQLQSNCQPDYVAADLSAAVEWILAQENCHHG